MLTEKKVLSALNLPYSSILGENKRRKEGVETFLFDDLRDYESLRRIASLNYHNIGIPRHETDTKNYNKVIVMALRLRPWADPHRAIETIHTKIPYPVILIVTQCQSVSVSGAHRLRSEGRKPKRRLEGIQTIMLDDRYEADEYFVMSLDTTLFPRIDLNTFYGGWLDRIKALKDASQDPDYSWDHLLEPDPSRATNIETVAAPGPQSQQNESVESD